MRYYIHDRWDCCQIQLSGVLTGDDVPELQGCWTTIRTTLAERKLVLDIRGLESADEEGRQWLASMQAGGATLLESSAEMIRKSRGLLRKFFSAAST